MFLELSVKIIFKYFNLGVIPCFIDFIIFCEFNFFITLKINNKK